MNPKDGFDFNEILWSFLDQSRSGAKKYERDHPLPLAWRPFTVVFVQLKGYSHNNCVNQCPVIVISVSCVILLS